MLDQRPNTFQVVSKLFARVGARGLAEVAGLGLERVRGWVSSSEELVILVRDTDPSAPEIPGLAFREATAADGPAYARDIGTDSRSTFAARLTEATRCFLVEAEGRLVHATWMTTSGAWTREVRGYLRPPSGDAYVYESFTRADARGRGVYPYALEHISAALHGRGIKRMWVAVEAHNAASLRAVAKAGFEPSFEISYRRSAGKMHVDAPECGPGGLERLCLSRDG